MKRLDGTDTTFKNFLTTPAYRTFAAVHWMPPNLTGLDDSTWPTSPVGRAVNFMKTCATNRALCQWGPIPTTRPGGGDGSRLRNPVTLTDREVADQAVQLLGVNVPGAESRCGECHALTRSGLTTWRNLTMTALDTCLAEYNPGESQTERFANVVVPRNQFTVYGPFSVGLGGRFEARLTGGGDADLYVKKGAAVTQTVYDCRPNTTSSNETCGRAQFDAWGPGQFYVGVLGRATTSTVSLEVTYNANDGVARDALERVSCMRMEPANPLSPFSPVKVGMASAAAHRPYFE
jgi:hypothetical protein